MECQDIEAVPDDELLMELVERDWGLNKIVKVWFEIAPVSEEETINAGRELVQDSIQGMKIFLAVSKAVEEKREVNVDEYERQLREAENDG